MENSMKSAELIEKMMTHGMGPFIGVPCSVLKNIFSYIKLKYPDMYLTANNEGEALSIATGMSLAQKRPVVLMQNSGIGNMMNPFVSLNQVYKLPIIFIISWRGHSEIKDSVEHEIMGKITIETLKLLDMSIIDLTNEMIDVNVILEKIEKSNESNKSCCILVNKNTFDDKEEYIECIDTDEIEDNVLGKDEVIMALAEKIEQDTIIVSGTGIISRELFHFADRDLNFYMLGSMGCASSIGLGLALETNKKVIVLEGDGSFLMRMENIVSIGNQKPQNLIHIIVIDGEYETTGHQKVNIVDYKEVVKGCGCNKIYVCKNYLELCNSIEECMKNTEYSTILAQIKKRTNIQSRVSKTPEEIKMNLKTNI